METIKNLTLAIISVTFKWFLFPIFFPYTILKYYWLNGWKGGNEKISGWLLEIAISQDRLANAMYKEPLNDLLIFPNNKVSFGNGKETISKVLGKAKVYKRFKHLGYQIAKALNIIDPNHVEDAIINE